MSLDGVVVYNLCREIEELAIDARVERIAQPSRDMIIFHLRSPKGNKKLLINTSADSARIQFAENLPENPQTPPMFCMLLRKHLQSARLIDVEQLEVDRVVTFVFGAYNELGDKIQLYLVVEIMGRYSNAILLNNEKKIIDAMKKIDFEASTVRQILPGLPYILPPLQDKLNIITASTNSVVNKITAQQGLLSKGILSALQGFSPLPAREIAFLTTDESDKAIDELSEVEKSTLTIKIDSIKEMLISNQAVPTMVLEKNGRPKDITFMPVTQYGDYYDTKAFDSFSGMLEYFYQRKDNFERMRQRSGTLLKLLENTLKRIGRRLSAQKEELEQGKNREELKIKGDILTANIHQISRGDEKVVLQNFYDPDYSDIEIKLDPRKGPAKNAQYYYSQYRKADTAEKKLTVLIKDGEIEEKYIESVIDSLRRSETDSELNEIKNELVKANYLKEDTKNKRKTVSKSSTPMKFMSSDGFIILVGRNNTENDRLTLKDSDEHDIWLHVKNTPGSHTVIVTEGKLVTDSALIEAATIAAYHSKARDSSKTPVDYTEIKNVRRTLNGKPGMVNYEKYKTLFVTPNQSIVTALEDK